MPSLSSGIIEQMFYIDLTIIYKVLQFIQGVIVGTREYRMSIEMPKYNEEKATQIAAFLLQQSDCSMGLLEFTKIMYNIQREAIERWSFPISYEAICSMSQGQVLSDTYDNSKPNNHRVYWDEYIDREQDVLSLKKSCPVGQLCRAEMSLIKEIYNRDKNKGLDQLLGEHHKYLEWSDPGDSSIPTDYEELFRVLGKTPEQISVFKNDLKAETYMEELVV